MGKAKGLENLHLVTYDIRTLTYQDQGAIFYENGDRPLYVNSIAVGQDGSVYFLARITENDRTRTDLLAVSAAEIGLRHPSDAGKPGRQTSIRSRRRRKKSHPQL
ncbi:MAG: hypothetical protein AMXMBFR4_30190 [Candidatus Hydrogenedentota bacterium]